MTIHVGILGAGSISDTHARAAESIPDVEIVAVYGRDAGRAASLAAAHTRPGARAPRAYADVQGFLAHRPMELVLVGTPSGLHAEHGIAAAAQGLHVLVEKPLDISTARADALIEACDAAGVRLGVFFQDRTAPGLRWLERLVRREELGRPLIVSARVRWYRPPEYYAGPRFRGRWELDGGGAVMAQGIHTLDLLLWLLGDVERVQATMRTAVHGIEVEDTAVATLEFAAGAVGTFEATTAAFPGFPRTVEVSGTEGTVVVQGDRVAAVALRQPPTESPLEVPGALNPSANSPTISDPAGHRAIIADFLEAMRTGERPLCDGREARRSVALVEAIYRAARGGQPVVPA